MAGPRSANIKVFLLIAAVVIVLGILTYTQNIVRQLMEKEREVADMYATSLEFIANSSSTQTDYSFIFDEVIGSIDFPVILTDASQQPIPEYSKTIRNIRLDTTQTIEQQKEYLLDVVRNLDLQNQPIKVAYQDTIVINYVHYGESELVTKLRYLPYVELAVGAMFILIGYIGFSYIKRNEQSNIWVGMAKETAHQLGTPLSSLLGWIEMMKVQAEGNPKQLESIAEMENDLKRLNKVAERFSKIGSRPNLKEEDLHDVIESVIFYFRRRLPTRFGEGRNIDLRIEGGEHFACPINRELFEWVIENLIKNAIDAIEERSGSIVFSIVRKGNAIMIDVADTGKGIDMKYRKDIFRPGYSTKTRGWGLGLSLSKRIIETYHKGKLFVKESHPGRGTTFRIRLNR
jgi:signal transduction histidine kinase